MAGGFRPVNDINGTDYNGQVQSYYVLSSHATLLQAGDAILQTGNVTTINETTYPNADAATNSSLISGFIVGVEFNPSNLEQQGLPAGVGGIIKVAPSFPDLLLSAEISDDITTTQVGHNAPILPTAASLVGGLAVSNMKIDVTSTATTSNQIRIENLIGGGIITNARVICRVNPAFSTFAGSVGV